MPTLLFLVLTLADGTRQASDVALTADRETCEALASELNKSPRKPPNVVMMCRPFQPVEPA